MPKHSHAKYYEAIIQLRPYNLEVFKYIMKHAQQRKDMSISEIKELKHGIDMYISDHKFATAIGKKLKQYFKGEVKYSYKLHTVSKTGKKLYRTTVLFRLKEQEEVI